MKMSVSMFFDEKIGICHEHTFKYAFALILLPEAISQSSPDTLEPLGSFLWDWKAASQGKAKPPLIWTASSTGKRYINEWQTLKVVVMVNSLQANNWP